MNNYPKVSIIIPTYNSEKFLDRTIKSVIDQTYKDWELIIVDDCSTDKTREIIKNWEAKDKRIRSVFLERNSGGPARPKNKGFEISQGEYIAYLDHDDEWLPEKLEKQLSIFAKYKNHKIGLVSCGANVINENRRTLVIYKPNNSKSIKDLLIGNYIFSNSSVLLPRQVIENIGPRDESKVIGYYEDWDMWVRVALNNYRLYSVQEPLINYLAHSNNASNKTNTLVRAKQNIAFYNKHIDLYQKYNLEYIFLSRIGLSLALAKQNKLAREYYKKSINLKKDYIIPYLGILLTYFGLYINRIAVQIYHIAKGEWAFLVFHR